MRDELSAAIEKPAHSVKGVIAKATSSRTAWKHTIISTVMFTMLAGTAAAQSAEGAEQALCDSGLGQGVGILLLLLTAGLGIFAAFRGAIGFANMGSSRSEKVQQGRSQVRGAGLALVGAMFPAAISFALSALGIPTLSCIDLNIISMIAPLI